MSETKKDLFDPKNKKSNSNFVQWTEVGQRVVGTLVARDVRVNRLKPGQFQEVYTLLDDEGTEFQIAGRMPTQQNGKTVAIIGRLHQVKLGTYVGVEFNREEKDNGQPQPTKILEVYDDGEVRQDVLDKYRGVAASKDVAGEEEPGF